MNMRKSIRISLSGVIVATALCLAIINLNAIRHMRKAKRLQTRKTEVLDIWFHRIQKVGAIKFPKAMRRANLKFMSAVQQNTGKTANIFIRDIEAGTKYEVYCQPEEELIKFVFWCPEKKESEAFSIPNPGIPPVTCLNGIKFQNVNGSGFYTLMDWTKERGTGERIARYRITLNIEAEEH